MSEVGFLGVSLVSRNDAPLLSNFYALSTSFIREYKIQTSCRSCLFLDFAKAFDKLDHSILIQKTQKNGVVGRLLKIITSYLMNRKQFVQIGSFKLKFL